MEVLESNHSIEQNAIIASEEYARIEAALQLNRLTDAKLQQLEKLLINRLHECRRKLEETHYASEKKFEFQYLHCGKPYFKDRSGHSPPDNDDTNVITKSNMLNVSSICTLASWTMKDKSEFILLLQKISQGMKKKQIISEIAHISKENNMKENMDTDGRIEALQRELETVAKMKLSDLALPIDKEYDWENVAKVLSYRHSAQEYRALWKLFLHPSINKNSWTVNEHASLQNIVDDYQSQDWDKISQVLNTGRTGYQCFIYYRTNMSNKFTNSKWTKDEEDHLKKLIEDYRQDNYIPWTKVAAAMKNRTYVQLYNKYLSFTEQRKGRFLREEDEVLLTSVIKFGTNFKKIAKYLPGRSAKQIRIRYHILSTRKISSVWTEKNDRKLIQLMANQDSTNYSSMMKYFPGKDRHQIRARYRTLAKWMEKYPDLDISCAPRRGARLLGHGQVSSDLDNSIRKLNKTIESGPCKTNKINTTKQNMLSKMSKSTIENRIITVLINEHNENTEGIKSNREERFKSKDSVISEGQSLNVTNLHKILLVLKANLNKTLFKNSSYNARYPGLLEKDQAVSLVKMKSYSRKTKLQTITVKDSPDIWGIPFSEPSKYVFPPNYATITGCRKLMKYITVSDDIHKLNLAKLIRYNCYIKKEINILMERFNALFLWPMLLSDKYPDITKYKQCNSSIQFTLPDDKHVIRRILMETEEL